MDIRRLDPTYAVAPQIELSDMAALAQAGFKAVICNRPDPEIPPALHHSAQAEAAAQAGLKFSYLPVTMQDLTPQTVADQAALIEDAGGPVLAYCASGTRSCILWALGQVQNGHQDPEAVIAAAAKAGYSLEALRPTLEHLKTEVAP